MGLRDDLRTLNTDLTGALDKIADDLRRLEAKLSESSAAEDVSEELAALRASVNRAQGLDLPDPDGVDTGTAGGGSIIRPTDPVPDITTVQSPGEPINSVDDLPDETRPEEVPPGQESGPTPGELEEEDESTDSE